MNFYRKYDADNINDGHADVADTLERVSWVYFAKMPAWTWMLGLSTIHMAPNSFRSCCSDGFSNSYIYYKYKSMRNMFYRIGEIYIMQHGLSTWRSIPFGQLHPMDLHSEKQQIANAVYIRNMVYRTREIHIIHYTRCKYSLYKKSGLQNIIL